MLPSCVEIEECLWIHDMAVGVGYGYGVYRHFQQYFSYFVEKTVEIHRPALNHYKRYHITLDRVHPAWAGF